MRVIATARGYDGINLREVGEEFDMPDGSKGSWFTPVEPEEKPQPTAKRGKGKAAADDDLA